MFAIERDDAHYPVTQEKKKKKVFLKVPISHLIPAVTLSSALPNYWHLASFRSNAAAPEQKRRECTAIRSQMPIWESSNEVDKKTRSHPIWSCRLGDDNEAEIADNYLEETLCVGCHTRVIIFLLLTSFHSDEASQNGAQPIFGPTPIHGPMKVLAELLASVIIRN